jgi:hypothetical protein
MLKMKATISFISYTYALGVYSGVEVTVGLQEGEWPAPLRKDLRMFILCPRPDRHTEVEESKRECLFCC